MKILCAFGKYSYGNPLRGLGYEYVNFIPAFESLGHEVSFFDTWDRNIYTDFTELNRAFLDEIEKQKPDVIFCVLMGYELWQETLAIARNKSGAVLINWSTDDSWKYEQFSKFVSRGFDLYVTTYQSAIEKAKLDGLDNFILSQWAANGEHLLDPKPARLCKYKISFIGSAYGNRRKWIHSLMESGFEVDCFGYGWDNGVIGENELPYIINDSIVSLNFGDSGLMFRGLLPYRSRQIKARIFEVLGYGGFLVTEPAIDLDKYYRNGEDLQVFDDMAQLKEILTKYLTNYQERDRVAKGAHRKTIQMHTYQNRFEEILKVSNQFLIEKKEGNNNVVQKSNIDPCDFVNIANSHEVGFWLKILRNALLIPCVFIWGKEKGARAARRILYECSWRIAGGKTYSAQGLPGRLFYKET
jgi:spore maturation protein CgeB